ncbi:MAG: hypothetical protein HZA46_07765 [Planctomycetales bacterium]|nr:hypothetical protein [Planctomycetales bacterium]
MWLHSDTRQIETVGIPATADGWIVAGEAINVSSTSLGQQLQLRGIHTEPLAMLLLNELGCTTSVFEIGAFCEAFRIVENGK